MAKEQVLTIGDADDESAYPIYVGSGILHRLRERVSARSYSQVLVLTDEQVEEHWGEVIGDLLPEASFLTVPAGEETKTLVTVAEIWETLLEAGADRETLLINLGGGMISDLGGYVASCFMRGIRFVNVPTSLLAQVDASVGAKTGINFAGVKNCIGTFCRPDAVIIDAETLTTLDRAQWSAGLAEMIKHGFIYDEGYLTKIEKALKKEWTPKEFEKLIADSCRLKATIVQEDEKERGIRKLLNFGHTIGHAIEAVAAASHEPYLHGEAVALGMLAESRIAEAQGILDASSVNRLEAVLTKAELPTRFDQELDIEELIHMTSFDKKKSGEFVQYTLPDAPGSARINQRVTPEELEEALQSLFIDEE